MPLNLITTRRAIWIYYCIHNTLKHNRIILYHIWYLLHDEPTVLYIFQNTPSIVSACCIKFNYYKMRIYSITVFFNTLSIIAWWTNCIIFDICYSWHQQCYIYSRIPPVLISTCCIEFTLLLYSTTLSSIIASFCITFDICYMRTNSTIYIPEYAQYWFQHAAITVFYNTLK